MIKVDRKDQQAELTHMWKTFCHCRCFFCFGGFFLPPSTFVVLFTSSNFHFIRNLCVVVTALRLVCVLNNSISIYLSIYVLSVCHCMQNSKMQIAFFCIVSKVVTAATAIVVFYLCAVLLAYKLMIIVCCGCDHCRLTTHSHNTWINCRCVIHSHSHSHFLQIIPFCFH